jgi:hypothetical protein
MPTAFPVRSAGFFVATLAGAFPAWPSKLSHGAME